MAVPTPLTTTFTPAPTCLSEIHWATNSPWFQLGPGTQCIPPGPDPSMSSFYSPGLYCPQGYTVACSTEVTNGAATETRATCCPEPTALGSLSSAAFSCQVNTLFFATSYGCVLGLAPFASNSLTVVATNVSTFQSAFSVSILDAVNAYSVQIRWQESDLRTSTDGSSSSTSSSASTISSSTRGATSTGATTTGGSSETGIASSTDSTASASSGGLSTGAKIAIGVVIPVVVIAVIIAAFLLMRRRKRAQPGKDTFQTDAKNELPTPANNHQDMKYFPTSELDGTPRYEVDSGSKEPVMKG